MNDTQQFERLLQLVRGAAEVPPGLAFWIRSQGDRSGMAVWSDCPRADWMLWIANQLNVSPALIARATAFATQAAADAQEKYGRDSAPISTAAAAVRSKINWADVVYGEDSDSGAVTSAWT